MTKVKSELKLRREEVITLGILVALSTLGTSDYSCLKASAGLIFAALNAL